MISFVKKTLGYALGIALIIYLLYTTHFDWTKLLYLSGIDFVWLSLMSIFLLFLNGISLAPQLALFGLVVPRLEVFMISQFYNILNYLPLKAGLVGEGIQLNRRYGLSYKKYVIANIITYVFNFLIYAVVALVLFLFFPFQDIFPFAKPVYFLIFLASFAVGFFVYFFAPHHFAGRKWLAFLFEDREIIWQSKRQAFFLFALTFLGFIINALRLLFIFRILGYDISVVAALMMSIFSSLSFLFGVTPGGIGIREGVMGALSFLIFHDVAAGVAVSVIVRIFDFVWVAVFSAYAFHFLTKNKFFKKNVQNQENSQ